MKCKWLFFFSIIALPVSAGGAWQEWQPVVDRAMGEIVEHYETLHPGADIAVDVTSPDPRLKLKACDDNLTLDLSSPPNNGGHLSILARCLSDTPWSIYLKAEADIWKKVVITNRTLARGERITNADIKLKALNIADIRSGVLFAIEAAVGKEAKRHLKAGFPIKINQLAEPMVIKRGDRVQIAAVAGGLRVLMTGTALANGRLGQQIPISNDKSNRKVRAKVVAEGRVEVPM